MTDKPVRVLVCGDRNWINTNAIWKVLEQLCSGSVVIEGGCRGADRIAADAAKALGLTVEEYPADWEKYHRAAGPIRNKQMLVEGKPDIVYAFHADLASSRGTKHMVNLAKKAGVPVVVVAW